MKAQDVQNAEQAKQFLQEQEQSHTQLIQNLPSALRRYATEVGITQQAAEGQQQIYFLTIKLAPQHQAELSLHWFDANSKSQAASSQR